jgi:hypothetical protein
VQPLHEKSVLEQDRFGNLLLDSRAKQRIGVKLATESERSANPKSPKVKGRCAGG